MKYARVIGAALLTLTGPAWAAGPIKDASRASREDVRQAEKFLAQLPPACADSQAYASKDGTVNIRLACAKDGKVINGVVQIKDGIVKNVQ